MVLVHQARTCPDNSRDSVEMLGFGRPILETITKITQISADVLFVLSNCPTVNLGDSGLLPHEQKTEWFSLTYD